MIASFDRGAHTAEMMAPLKPHRCKRRRQSDAPTPNDREIRDRLSSSVTEPRVVPDHGAME
jgi:hypothetical protein